ncbi:MAG TPA: hypothetical protein DCR14_03215 [Acidimicrobiaceae bacterium]|nr:hypothetical protein [Acidimicrobiaceae bacterium]
MLALSLETAKTIAVVVLLAFLAIGVVSAWIIKNITMKLITVGIMAALALGVWTQRSNLQNCADEARANVSAGTTKVSCTFFGTDVEIGV